MTISAVGFNSNPYSSQKAAVRSANPSFGGFGWLNDMSRNAELELNKNDPKALRQLLAEARKKANSFWTSAVEKLSLQFHIQMIEARLKQLESASA